VSCGQALLAGNEVLATTHRYDAVAFYVGA